MKSSITNFSGRKFQMSVVESGHKKGIFCLRCGIFCEGLMCEDCKVFDRCVLCGIVCRPYPTYRTYFYAPTLRQRGTGVVSESYKDVHPFCKILKDGLCEDCVCWEDFIRNKCFMCGDGFQNNYKNFRERGNMCADCFDIIKGLTKVWDKNGNPKNPHFKRFGRKTVTDKDPFPKELSTD
jgi:hypothetical protein